MLLVIIAVDAVIAPESVPVLTVNVEPDIKREPLNCKFPVADCIEPVF